MIIVFACLLTGCHLYGQQPEFLFDHYGPAQGLHSSEIFDIIQTHDQFLWLATDEGLVRYDGHTFKYFVNDPMDSTSLSHDYVTRIVEDKHRRIWIVAGKYVDVFDPLKNQFYHPKAGALGSEMAWIYPSSCSYNARGDTMWISSKTGIWYSTSSHINLQKLPVKGLTDVQCAGQLSLDRNFNLFLSTNYGAYRIETSGSILQTIHSPGYHPDTAPIEGFISHMEDAEGTIWLTNWSIGLHKVTPDGHFQQFFYSLTSQNAIYSICETAQEPGQLFLGTIHGLKIFDKHHETFTDLSSKFLPSEYGVPGAVFVIKEFGDALWIGSGKGLHCLDFRKHIFEKFGIPGLQSDVFAVSEIQFERFQEEERFLWFGIPYLGAYRYDLLKRRLTDIPQSLRDHTGSDAGVHTLFVDAKHQLWISSERYGVSAYDLQYNLYRIKSTKADGHPIVLDMAESPDHTIWFTTVYGLWSIREDQDRIYEVKPVTTYLKDHRLSTLIASPHVDGQGRVWFVSGWNDQVHDAVCCFDPASGLVWHLDSENNKEIGSIGHIEGMNTSASGACIVYGDHGFAYARIPDNDLISDMDFVHVKTEQKCFFAEENINQFWLSLKTGITLYDISTQKMISFSDHNSTVGETMGPSITFSPVSKKLFIGQMDYLSVLDLHKPIIPSCGPPVLAELTVKDKRLDRLPVSGESLRLNHAQNVLVFSFTNFSFTDSELNNYSFRLNPDESWQTASDNQIRLNSLGYGDYQLEVKTTNAFGVPAEEMYTLKIQITPPFTRTWWFSAIVMALILSALYALYRNRVAHLQKLNQIRLNIARDLHDDMGGNLSQVKILSEVEAGKPGSHPLFRKINTKLGMIMDNMSEIVWSINPQKDDLSEIVLHIQQYAVEILEPLNINLHFNIDPIPAHYRFNIEQRRHFYLIFKEAISNIAKYASAHNVTFELKLAQGKLHVQISDNGIGFDPNLITRGNGLRIMNERAKLIGGDLKIATSPAGTSVQLTTSIPKSFISLL